MLEINTQKENKCPDQRETVRWMVRVIVGWWGEKKQMLDKRTKLWVSSCGEEQPVICGELGVEHRHVPYILRITWQADSSLETHFIKVKTNIQISTKMCDMKISSFSNLRGSFLNRNERLRNAFLLSWRTLRFN